MQSTATKVDASPYDTLIGNGDPARYEQHRQDRNRFQREKLLSPLITSLDIDPILYKLVNPSLYPGFRDHRHCLVFWARPTKKLHQLISQIQQQLRTVAPRLWCMAPENLHMTVLEVAHSLTEQQIQDRLEKLRPILERITDYTYAHRTRLIKPMLSYDASAVALGFVTSGDKDGSGHDDSYTYHHLRRDLWSLCRSTGVEIASRYVVPSAHLTIARFVTYADHITSTTPDNQLDPEKMKVWVNKLDEANAWLKERYWPIKDGTIPEGGQWNVGEEHGLDCMAGTIWYGRGTKDAISQGKGF